MRRIAPLLLVALATCGERGVADGDEALARAFRERQSGLLATGRGVVQRVLVDDREGDRHQRFVLRLASGQTLLVAHNIDVAERVPLRAGEQVSFLGLYEWNAQGGVIHWTHHDPRGARAGGWIEHAGIRYR